MRKCVVREGELMTGSPYMENPYITDTVLLLLFGPLILGIIIFPSNLILVSILVIIWVWDVIFVFYSMFCLHAKIVIDDGKSNVFPFNNWVATPTDIKESTIVEGAPLLVISVLTAVWITIHPLMSIILVLMFVCISFIYETIFPIEDEQGNAIRFDSLRINILIVLDFAFLPVIIASAYYATDTVFMWPLIGLWFVAILTHFNSIRREKVPPKRKRQGKAETVRL
ncbi:MAG: hypothetical protein JSW28_03395 [Thermoplasmata archaeon]|nr:MAG: hypothetical protein JSW28_03395 [Thermoplasmata archaeon]